MRMDLVRAASCVGLLLTALPVRAQQVPLAEVLPELLGNTIVLRPTNENDQPNHLAHFRPGPDQLEVPGQFNQALLTILSTYPLGSPSGGFTYTFDPALGTFSRNSESFGSAFGERALTIGKGRVSVGFGFLRATYDSFEGNNLRQRATKFYIRHIDCCSRGGSGAFQPDGSLLTPAFEGDLIEAALRLDAVTDTSVVYLNYGVTDRFDLSAAVPFVRARMSASVLARIDRLATAAEPTIHAFSDTEPDERLFALSSNAAGLGDIVLRGKYVIARPSWGGVGAAFDLRVPTGDETNLLGTGGWQSKASAIISFNHGRVSPHLNLGYTVSSSGGLPGVTLADEVNFVAGVDAALTPRVTLAVDLLGRTLLDAGRLREIDKVFQFARAGTGTGGGGGGGGSGGGGGGGGATDQPTISTATRREFQLMPGDLSIYTGSVGFRINPWRSVLVSLNLLVSMSEAGLRDRVTPVLGLDYAF